MYPPEGTDKCTYNMHDVPLFDHFWKKLIEVNHCKVTVKDG